MLTCRSGLRWALTILATLAAMTPALVATPARAVTLPPKSLIHGVPFVAWSTAARSQYENKNDVNPSWEAACRMIEGYWAPPGAPAGRAGEVRRALLAEADSSLAKPASLEDLKSRLAEGIPVFVVATMTPYAHPLPASMEMGLAFGAFKESDFGPKGSRSNYLGRMVALEAIEALPDSIRSLATHEANTAAARVLVGYDDDRRVFLVHEPSFGPAFELGYEDFERMWKLTGRLWSAPRPAWGAGSSANASAYPPPTPDQQAARAFVYGYALSSTRRLEEGARELEAGSKLTGLSPGYRHLILFELALNYGEQNRMNDAAATAQQAAEALPDDPMTWSFLSMVYPMTSLSDRDALRDKAEKQAKKLGKDKKAMSRLAKALPSDMWIPELASVRGWAAP